MKTSMIALSTAIVFVLSGSAATAGINFSGALDSNLEWRRALDGTVEVKPESTLDLNFGFDTAGESTRAVVEFGLKEKNRTGLDLGMSAADLKLKKAYIETEGSFWYGGPEATTRFGSLDINYGPFTSVNDEYGVSVSNLQVGPAKLNGFYAIPTEESAITGINARVKLNDMQAGSTIIHDNVGINVVVDAAVRPLDLLIVGGGLAVQKDFAQVADPAEANASTGVERLWVVSAQYQVADNMSVHAGYRSISNDWKPAYIAKADSKNDQGQNWVHEGNRIEKGIYVGVATEQQGVKIAADYDQMFEEATLAAETNMEGYAIDVETVVDVAESGISTKNTTFGVGKSFAATNNFNVETNYKGVWTPGEGLAHTLGAKTIVTMVPAVNGMGLSSEVTVADKETIGYSVGADFKAPNGINLGVKHVGGNFSDGEVVVGTSATAGISVMF